MKLQLCHVRIDAMCRLYEMYEHGPRTTDFMDQIDTALNLALGEKRAADNPNFLCRSLLRDARRTNRRSRDNSRAAAAGRPLADARHRRLVSYASDGAVNAELVSYITPEENVLADEIIQELNDYALTLGAHGPDCLRGLIQGEPAAVTAQRAGVSVATIDRARRSLREFTEELIAPQP
ncbi:hypothetical protein [Streptomyces sp. NPDC058545]|uniref:hypothetical protein n=1 Tax=Streptomyces sp. NPDC058545 TaxID=3346544 RepID=UPI0036593FDC